MISTERGSWLLNKVCLLVPKGEPSCFKDLNLNSSHCLMNISSCFGTENLVLNQTIFPDCRLSAYEWTDIVRRFYLAWKNKVWLPEQSIAGHEERIWHFWEQLEKEVVSTMSHVHLLKLQVFWHRFWLMWPPAHFSSARENVANMVTSTTNNATAVIIFSNILWK